MKLRGLFWLWGGSSDRSRAPDSVKARKVVHEAHIKSGGPTPELKRVYGEYLEYERAKDATSKNR